MAETLVYSKSGQSINPALAIEYIFSKELTDLSDIMPLANSNDAWTKHNSEILNLGLKDGIVWIRFSVENKTNEALYLDATFNTTEHIDVYKMDSSGNPVLIDQTGFAVSLIDRLYKSNLYLTPISSGQERKTDLLIKIQSDSSKLLPFSVASMPTMYQKHFLATMFTGTYLGFILVMIFYNLILYLSLRDKLYLLYVGYAISVMLLMFEIKGLFAVFTWPEMGFLSYYSDLANAFAGIMSITFTRALLQTKKYIPRVDNFMLFLCIAFVFMGLIELSGFFFLAEQVMMVCVLISVLTLLGVAIYYYKHRLPYSGTYLIAWGSYLCGILVFVGWVLGWMPNSLIVENAIMIGSGIELVLLSLLLANRISDIKQENKRLVEAQNVELEQKVKIRTRELSLMTSKLKSMNSKLANQSDILQSSNRKLSEFAASVSHDLKSPIRNITGFLQIISSRYGDKFDESGKEFIEFAVNGAKDMDFLINELLAFSMLKNEASLDDEIDLNQLLGSIENNLHQEIHDNNVQVKYNKLPVIIGSRLLVTQVLQNLIQNAIKYNDKSEPIIEVIFEQCSKYYRFEVKDNGPGIEAENLEKIFSRFWKIQSSADPNSQGIGLHTCKRLVNAFGGQIWAESESGAGSSFIFTMEKDIQNIGPINSDESDSQAIKKQIAA